MVISMESRKWALFANIFPSFCRCKGIVLILMANVRKHWWAAKEEK